MRRARGGAAAARSALAVVVVTTAIEGCGLHNPYPTSRAATSATAATVTTAPVNQDPAPERGGTVPPGTPSTAIRPGAAAVARSPQAAIERYAALFLNWTAHTVVARQGQLAALSIGQAHAAAVQAAVSVGHDALLQRNQVTNQGDVIALAAGRGEAASRWVLVTREQTTGLGSYAGLPPTLHVIYAQVTRAAGGWVVSQWQPQN